MNYDDTMKEKPIFQMYENTFNIPNYIALRLESIFNAVIPEHNCKEP